MTHIQVLNNSNPSVPRPMSVHTFVRRELAIRRGGQPSRVHSNTKSWTWRGRRPRRLRTSSFGAYPSIRPRLPTPAGASMHLRANGDTMRRCTHEPHVVKPIGYVWSRKRHNGTQSGCLRAPHPTPARAHNKARRGRIEVSSCPPSCTHRCAFHTGRSQVGSEYPCEIPRMTSASTTLQSR